jgi:hypothetical protein
MGDRVRSMHGPFEMRIGVVRRRQPGYNSSHESVR